MTFHGYALTYLVNGVWQVPVFALLAFILDRALQRADSWRHRIWRICMMCSAIIPAISGVPWLIWKLSTTYGSSGTEARIRIVLKAAAAAPHGTVSILEGAALLWSIASIFLLLRLLLSLHGLATLIQGSKSAKLCCEASDVWNLCRQRFHLRKAQLLSSEHIVAPATCGVRRPVILLPPSLLAEGSTQDLLAALAHESAHVERRDYAWNLLCEWLTLLIAWHPATWLLRAGMERTRELHCDKLALERISASPLPSYLRLDVRSYAGALLRFSAATLPSPSPKPAVGILDGNIMETRIMAVLEPGTPLRSGRKHLLVAASALLLIGVVTVTTQAAFSLQTPAVQASGSHTYTPGKGITNPKLIYSIDPSFPHGPHVRPDFQGVSVIGVVVDRAGQPQDVHVIRSLTPEFDEQAMKAIRQYRFQPGMKDGVPVRVALSIEVNFQRFSKPK